MRRAHDKIALRPKTTIRNTEANHPIIEHRKKEGNLYKFNRRATEFVERSCQNHSSRRTLSLSMFHSTSSNKPLRHEWSDMLCDGTGRLVTHDLLDGAVGHAFFFDQVVILVEIANGRDVGHAY